MPATVLALPARPGPEPAQAERAALAGAIWSLKTVQLTADAARGPVERLEAAAGRAVEVNARLKALREQAQRRVAD